MLLHYRAQVAVLTFSIEGCTSAVCAYDHMRMLQARVRLVTFDCCEAEHACLKSATKVAADRVPDAEALVSR